MKRFLLVRHGAPENPLGLYYGRMKGFPLSELGRAQALAVAEILADRRIDCVHTSPLQRARETARTIGRHLHLTVNSSSRLQEVCTPYDGWQISDLSVRGWDLYDVKSPRFERPADVVKRLRRFMLEHAAGTCVAVTHGDVIAFAVLTALAQPLESASARRLGQFGLPDDYPPQASFTEILLSSTGEMRLGETDWNHVKRIEAA